MATKKDLDDFLSNDKTSGKPIIRRGQGLTLSTEIPPSKPAEINPKPAPPETPAAADPIPEPQLPPPPAKETVPAKKNPPKRAKSKSKNLADLPVKHKRVNRGYKLREDLIKGCKRIAVEEDRKLYEVMEEALSRYLAYKKHSVN